MSRTIKTMPPAVQAMDRHAVQEDHDHRKGHCDLPDRPTVESIGWGGNYWRSNCHWDYTHSFYYEGNHFCGCPMCTQQVWRRQERRQSRHNAKREARQIMKYGV